ncbi:MAG: hypothetical protein GX776_03890 [Oxalobacter sp.]|nr:hypothetical protein [Oxalobacter sp.]
MTRSLLRRKDYLLVQNSESDISTRILHATFPPEVLAFVRSEVRVLKLYNRVRERHPDKWKEMYLEAVLNVAEEEPEEWRFGTVVTPAAASGVSEYYLLPFGFIRTLLRSNHVSQY